ncbi:MAG: hypothetical protein MJA29_06430 [Candidatus Omnitrophica bacterium]|nr:hypothetical protein [Candidatus Omnitrophota bacterium]
MKINPLSEYGELLEEYLRGKRFKDISDLAIVLGRRLARERICPEQIQEFHLNVLDRFTRVSGNPDFVINKARLLLLAIFLHYGIAYREAFDLLLEENAKLKNSLERRKSRRR